MFHNISRKIMTHLNRILIGFGLFELYSSKTQEIYYILISIEKEGSILILNP
jgi:hypothetical protein